MSITRVLIIAALAGAAHADIIEYEFVMTGCQENPPVLTTGFGSAVVTLDTDTGDVTVEGEYSGMSSNVSAAHIHGLAGVGENAGVIVGLDTTGGQEGTVSGSGTLSDDEMQGMLDGLTYVNVHTGNHPGGEIRGQIVHECRGDFNGDGAKNILDFVDFQGAFLSQACEADVNHDLVYNILDFVAFQAVFVESCD